jgi:predicted CXXCH cytochrome family protein
MQSADAKSVLGNFDNAEFSKDGVVSRFLKRGGKYFVHTDGHAGGLADYEIRYTFGVSPLQQYLIEIPGGKLQALGIAWDARQKDQGGQRWYSLYPNRKLKAGDMLHWSGRDQNWNFMCASCHSTGVDKNFDLKTNSFKTTWAGINVACESCHGPGSKHVAWAQSHPGITTKSGDDDKGLLVTPKAAKGVAWIFDSADQRIASPHGDISLAKAASDNCFACHSRREELTTTPDPSRPFLDNYLPALLDRGLYHADGQIDGEVFEFGSFAQSKMYRAGVTCLNCHEAHSLKLRAPGNALCLQCHNATAYETRQHYHHPLGSSGAQCINCHMPHKTYMGVDERRDHSFRIPRPDLSVAFRTPNACTQCHAGKPPQWAADTIEKWTGVHRDTAAHSAAVIDAAWLDSPSADRLLAALIKNTAQPGIVRATALSLQAAPVSKQGIDSIALAAIDSDPLVRLGAARALATLVPENAVRIGAPLLADPLRAVRIEAARALAGTQASLLSAVQGGQLQAAVDELIRAELAAAERPETHVNLAQIYLRLDRATDAERELKTALRIDRRFVPAMVNLADLYRILDRDQDGERWLRQAISIAPGEAQPAHALGLFEVRHGRARQALPWLHKAAQLAPGEASYVYVYAMALFETGAAKQGLAVIEKAREFSPQNAILLEAKTRIENGMHKKDMYIPKRPPQK